MGKKWNMSQEGRDKISAYARKRYINSTVITKCNRCNIEYKVPVSRWNDGRGRYCSKSCMYADKKGVRYSIETEFKKGDKPWNAGKAKHFNCEYCGKESYFQKGKLNKFCSPSCRYDSGRRWYDCMNCGLSFTRIGTKPRKFCSQKCRSVYYSAENHPLWDGGKTTESEKIRKSVDYKNWRKEVFKRDDFTCKICNKRGGRLQADHIKPFSIFPSLRLDVSNGRTLCVDCHKRTDTYLVSKNKLLEMFKSEIKT